MSVTNTHLTPYKIENKTFLIVFSTNRMSFTNFKHYLITHFFFYCVDLYFLPEVQPYCSLNCVVPVSIIHVQSVEILYDALIFTDKLANHTLRKCWLITVYCSEKHFHANRGPFTKKLQNVWKPFIRIRVCEYASWHIRLSLINPSL